MEKEFGNLKVTETDDGYRLEISGKDIKEKGKAILENCGCNGKSWKDFFKNCCPAGK